MAKETIIEEFWLGQDFEWPVTVKNLTETACLNIGSWALSWMIKRRRTDVDADAVVTKTTVSGIAISGTFNADPAVNTQVATVTVTDTDTASLQPGTYFYELKRTDDASEAPIVYGTITMKRGVHR